MIYLSIKKDGHIILDKYDERLLNYIIRHDEDQPFELRLIEPEDNRYYLRRDENGFTGISLTRIYGKICGEEINNRGYKRIYYKDQKPQKSRLIYKLYGENPYNLDLDSVQIHHINLDKLDNRLENLYPISQENHTILHKYIDKYGKENVEL